VVTIDPAKRLANSLGLEELGNEPALVDPALFAPAGVEMEGELWAMMLDSKRTFDDLIDRLAPNEKARDDVLGNRIYQELSNAVAGSQEYMAMEKLHELHQEGRYDLLVLDTPPTRNALDFIDAPKKLAAFIDSRTLQAFTAPGVLGLKVVGRGSGMVFSVLKRATGLDLLEDLSAFFSSFAGMTEGFRERAEHVNALLADSRSAFVLVTSPRADAVEEAGWFHHRLLDAGLPFAGVVANRVRPAVPKGNPSHELGELLGDALARKVMRTFEEERRLAAQDRRNLADLRKRLGRKPMIEVPHLDDDVHDLDGLRRMDEHLFG
jgi:anion-transporting  ArsA/GET3 family ATPase